MKIAICEDNKNDAEQIIKYINKTFIDSENIKTIVYDRGQKLLMEFSQQSFDMIFLDIEMPGINGMETAREIRMLNKKVMLVFLTSYTEFLIQGYEVGAFRYILKGNDEKFYISQFSNIFNEFMQKNRKLTIATKNSTKTFFLADVLFIEVTKRTLSVHTYEKAYEFFGKLSDIEAELDNSLFTKSHKSFLVNMAQIDILAKDKIIMKNKQSIPLSRNYKNSITEIYVRYMADA